MWQSSRVVLFGYGCRTSTIGPLPPFMDRAILLEKEIPGMVAVTVFLVSAIMFRNFSLYYWRSIYAR